MALLAWLTGCAPRAVVLADPAYRVERGRSHILVVGASRTEELEGATRQARRLFADALATRWFNIQDQELLVASHPELAAPLSQAVRQLQANGRVESSLATRLLRESGVGQLFLVDVFCFDQYWGKLNKVTRVGVEARLVHVAEGRTLWQARYDPEISGEAGNGFDAATRRAVRELVHMLNQELPEFRDTPMADWPVLEYFTPN